MASAPTNSTMTMTTVLISVAQRRRRMGLDQSSESDEPDLAASSAVVGVVVGGHLALHGGPGDTDLHVVVDLEPEPVRPVLAGDLAEHPGGGHDLVADLDRPLQLLGFTGPPALRADHEEVHRERDEQQDSELQDGATATPAGVTGSEQGHGEKRRHNGERAYRRVSAEFRHPDERTIEVELWQRCRHDAATCVDRRRRVRRAFRGDADLPPRMSR